MSTPKTESLQVDLEQTRRHLADTVNRLSQQLNVPHRMKESAQALPHRMKEVPAMGKQHPRAAAAIGGAMLVLAGATAWVLSRRHG